MKIEDRIKKAIDKNKPDELISWLNDNVDQVKKEQLGELFTLINIMIYEVCDEKQLSEITREQLIGAITKIL